jgi:hypothetical protein
MNELIKLRALLGELHGQIRDKILRAFDDHPAEELSRVVRDEEGDTIFTLDQLSEEYVVAFVEKKIAPLFPVILIAEGIPAGKIILPEGTNETDAKWRIIIDPIDGTRVLMYQKRSAWILSGVAANKGAQTSLKDIELAVQTEIPLLKQHLCDSFSAIRGQGISARRYNRLDGSSHSFKPQPSTARTIAQGFAMISRYFPGARETLAAIDDEVVQAALGPVQYGKTYCFEDQYISDGGRLYELMTGHDRFIADLRPLMDKILAPKNQALGICCHPYDICTELIAREAGVIITGIDGNALDAPLDLESDVAWIGYANAHIRKQIEPLLRQALKKRGLI